jgi:hypothetical protein
VGCFDPCLLCGAQFVPGEAGFAKHCNVPHGLVGHTGTYRNVTAKAAEPTPEKARYQTNPPHAHAETLLYSYHLTSPSPTTIANRVRKALSQPQVNTLRTPSSRKILSRKQAKTRSSRTSAAEYKKRQQIVAGLQFCKLVPTVDAYTSRHTVQPKRLARRSESE